MYDFPIKFVDETGTKFTFGPFEIDGKKYDYKLEDKNGEDYCMEYQLRMWNVKINKVL